MNKVETTLMKDINNIEEVKSISVMLITNRDSDNVGDQVIEACDIQLIETIMKNLDISEKKYKIMSHAAGMVSKAYLKNPTPELHKELEDKIKKADIILFGGAPIFNYAYQVFYKRTIITLEIAQKYNIPVFFSSIGVEKYDENDVRCQQLKKALHFPVVKLITTRDDIDSLIKYQEPLKTSDKNAPSAAFKIAKVADPAVFSDLVFTNFANEEKNNDTIGCAVVRHPIFKDNGIKFSLNQQLKFWMSLRSELKNRGYEVQFFTTGHFTDEVFLDVMKRKYALSDKECLYNMNSPERLVKTIGSYKGVVAYRLHASIISYSLRIPGIGLTWNQKVPLFYDSINYSHRAYSVESWNEKIIADALESAIKEKVKFDEEHAMALYDSLFNAFKEQLTPESKIQAYTYKDLKKHMIPFKGTSAAELEQKAIRKQKRIYENYHAIERKLDKLKENKTFKFINKVRSIIKRK